MVRRGDPGTYRDLGRGRRSEGTEGFCPQRIRLRRNFGENARTWLLENLGPVPLESQVTEEQLPTVLRQEEVSLPVYLFANIIQHDPDGLYLHLFTRSRCGRKVDYRFYKQLEQILGQEAVSVDEYDERDEQADQDPGTVISIHSLSVRRNDPLDKHSTSFSNPVQKV